MSFPHLAATVSTPIPIIDVVAGPNRSDPGIKEWPHCVGQCAGNRSDRSCPLLTQYKCLTCNRTLAYITHGLKTSVKRRFYAETKIIHLWPSFQDEEHVYCTDCARVKYPTAEKVLGRKLELAWRDVRNYDHIAEFQG